MAGAITFLTSQMRSYWRNSFTVRGKYDSNSGFLLIVIAILLFQYVAFLGNTAKSFSEGNFDNFYLLLIIVFLSWFPTVLENQELIDKTRNFLFFPISKNQFTLASIFSLFLLPTALIPLFIFFSAIYPLIYLPNQFFGIISLFCFSLSSAFIVFAFVNFLKIKLFRYFVFLAIILTFLMFFLDTFNLSNFGQNISNEHLSNSFLIFCIVLFPAFLLSFVSSRQKLSSKADTTNLFRKQIFTKIKIPFKYGELIKKDFLYYWKTFDAWTSVLVGILFSIIFLFGKFSFSSFSVGLSLVLLMNGSLAFNSFGLEKVSGIDRLTLFPISSKDLLTTKNKSFALLVLSQTVFILLLVLYKFGLFYLAISILQIASIILLYTAWGNNLSVKYPFKMDFFQFSFGGSLPAMIYGALIISLLIIGTEFLTSGNLLLNLLANISLLVFSLFSYKYYLNKSSKLLSTNWEIIKLKIK